MRPNIALTRRLIDVRFWHKADVASAFIHVGFFWGKADIAQTAFNVCL
jgi:hypothetical protein